MISAVLARNLGTSALAAVKAPNAAGVGPTAISPRRQQRRAGRGGVGGWGGWGGGREGGMARQFMRYGVAPRAAHAGPVEHRLASFNCTTVGCPVHQRSPPSVSLLTRVAVLCASHSGSRARRTTVATCWLTPWRCNQLCLHALIIPRVMLTGAAAATSALLVSAAAPTHPSQSVLCRPRSVLSTGRSAGIGGPASL